MDARYFWSKYGSQLHGENIFYCYPSLGPPEKEPYQHLLVCFGEGLRQLGIEFYSDINYWQESIWKEQYFRHNPKNYTWWLFYCYITTFGFLYGRLFPEKFHPNRKYVTVYLDSQERNKPYSFNSEFRQFDFIFRTHYNSKFKYPSNFHPWFFGFPTEYFKSLKAYQIFKIKKHKNQLQTHQSWPFCEILFVKNSYSYRTFCQSTTLLILNSPPLGRLSFYSGFKRADTTWFTTNTWKSQLHALALGIFLYLLGLKTRAPYYSCWKACYKRA